MKVRVLGCSGAIAKDCKTTSFLLDGAVLIDAGTGVGDLTLEEMLAIDHVFLTHSHLDHIAALPLMVDAVASRRKSPVTLHALPETLNALKIHVFNNVIWPDFTLLPTVQNPFIRCSPLSVGEVREISNLMIEALPASHSVPALGYAASSEDGANWVFTGDTGHNSALWSRINQMKVGMLVIETAFSNRESELAVLSKHLAPQTLAQELRHIDQRNRYPIYITHTKPAETNLIMNEIALFEHSTMAGAACEHDIRWLSAGQEFEL